MKRILILTSLLVLMAGGMMANGSQSVLPSHLPKHEFRGAWMHIIGQKQYAPMSPEQTRQYLIEQLDLL